MKPVLLPATGAAARVGWLLFTCSLLTLAARAASARTSKAFAVALAVTAAFALAALLLRGVTRTGAAAGLLCTFLLYIAGGLPLFGAAFLVFVLTLAATRAGAARKAKLGIAERSGGRDGAQVLANVGCAAFAVGLYALKGHIPLLAASVAALAEAACDTVSSETGKAFSTRARLITTWRHVQTGTNGAISVPGTLGGVLAATVIAAEATLALRLSLHNALAIATCGILGMLFDSFLGATLESPGRMTNNTVNLLSTLFSAALAGLLTWQLG